ncbi:unnamed protein product [Chondrus crispus]|uniref:SET domain-containing protein n=1 Tax=Chondrus crispus TaxID=2769 RepID=R7QTM2_CHOCR|nr:unnamed protein product [Chondrus crispus]CDF40725.1 unnamed protein product [Chondrus crispus]|eukprot:XP_005711019.1 unnamed protein product [Chondrus crispus]
MASRRVGQASVQSQPSKLRRDLVNEIPDLVSGIMLGHLSACQSYAKKRVRKEVVEQEGSLPKERVNRDDCIRRQDWLVVHRFQKIIDDLPEQQVTQFDPSLSALDEILNLNSATRPSSVQKKGVSSRVIRVKMPETASVPKYDTWIPVRDNYWAGKQLHVEPYMPFLGDQDDDCELAFEVYEDMADDAGQQLDLSDGEVGKDGRFSLPKDDIERCTYYSMAQARWREGCRQSILAVLDKFKGKKFDESVWRVLATALGVKETGRIKAIARVAKDRRHEKRSESARQKKEKEMSRAVAEAKSIPVEDDMPLEEDWSARINPLKAFCFTCHCFPCPQHADVDVEPVLPIEDLAASAREKQLVTEKALPCSKHCWLAVPEDTDIDFDQNWSPQEIVLLREGVPMFGMDPCSLSVILGSRTCIEVSMKLDDNIETDIALHEIQKARKPHRVDANKRKQISSQDKDNKNNNKISAKTVVEKETDTACAVDQDFVPCHHNGPCTTESCTCVKKGMFCETTCGCNAGRYGEGGQTGGIVWIEPRAESLGNSSARVCRNRHFGCACEEGSCHDSLCPCWDQNRACSPDFCGCDCTLLPGQISLSKRKCRNVPASIAKHKKTFVGTSPVHGFGLFAGERFEAGDLVGAYSGQLIDTRLADMIGRLYDATDRTYIFNVTESLVIDGGLLGSKAKFCNHTKPGDKENCASKLVRVRGDAYVALFTKRVVEPGEEFLFDYRFTGEVPPWARDDDGNGNELN